jgi:hypothetical protein
LYLSRQAASTGRYILEQSVMFLFGWVPTIVGIGLRALAYRLMLQMNGTAAIERNVRLRFASHIRLGSGSYLDEGGLHPQKLLNCEDPAYHALWLVPKIRKKYGIRGAE